MLLGPKLQSVDIRVDGSDERVACPGLDAFLKPLAHLSPPLKHFSLSLTTGAYPDGLGQVTTEVVLVSGLETFTSNSWLPTDAIRQLIQMERLTSAHIELLPLHTFETFGKSVVPFLKTIDPEVFSLESGNCEILILGCVSSQLEHAVATSTQDEPLRASSYRLFYRLSERPDVICIRHMEISLPEGLNFNLVALPERPGHEILQPLFTLRCLTVPSLHVTSILMTNSLNNSSYTRVLTSNARVPLWAKTQGHA